MDAQKALLERIYARYAKPEYLTSDPVGLISRWSDPRDIETAGILCALFAYGGVKAMRSFLTNLLAWLAGTDGRPSLGLERFRHSRTEKSGGRSRHPDFYYRFQTKEDILTFLHALAGLMPDSEGPLWENCFGRAGDPPDERIDAFQTALLSNVPERRRTRGLIHLTGKGEGNGARKRMCMFLRWMVRREFPDFGLYKTFEPGGLIVPLDVHMLRIARGFGWTKRAAADWSTAREVTAALRGFDPEDPLRFDFPLTRIGILRDRKILSHDTAPRPADSRHGGRQTPEDPLHRRTSG